MGKFRELARVSLPYESFFFFFWRDPLRVTRVEQLDMFLVFYLLKQLYNLVAFDNESLLS